MAEVQHNLVANECLLNVHRHTEMTAMSVLCVFKAKDFCFGVNNEQYRCEMGYCCGETECCTYYYELWCKSLFFSSWISTPDIVIVPIFGQW